MNLSKNVKIDRVMNAVAAGTSDQNSASVDMAGFDGVMFIAFLGTLTATQVTLLTAQHSSDDSSFANITGGSTSAMADGDSNKMLFVDVFKPQNRYVRAVVDRGTANAVIDGVLAIQYVGDKAPFTHADVSQSALVVGA